MKVLITGVAGFLGTHVADYYRKKGWDVVGIDNLTDFELQRTKFNIEKSREHNLNFLKEIGVEFHKEDTRDVEADEEFQDVNFIIHCAAQPAMTIAIEEPKMDFSNNAEGTVNMLELARKIKVPFVNCSSIHVYGNKLDQNLVEADTRFVSNLKEVSENQPILQGDLTPLHASKRTTELYTQTYAETYGLRAATFRLTGMYGERQFGGMDHGWVANFAIRTLTYQPITIFGTDKQVRDILYAQDAAKAFDMWYQKGKSGIYNIGGGIECSISLGECLQSLSDITKIKQFRFDKPKRFGDLWWFICDYRKAEREFGWKPTTYPEVGLKKIVRWVEINKRLFK